ncbi:hypothetical protein BaRGS_00004457 [Batillaria attramentaria]|uniref:Uncharacterized protein n=1 Tax=Batillaria attramentaria TaxID=370345 RepID=A0ABD0LYQ8_9CAEN
MNLNLMSSFRVVWEDASHGPARQPACCKRHLRLDDSRHIHTATELITGLTHWQHCRPACSADGHRKRQFFYSNAGHGWLHSFLTNEPTGPSCSRPAVETKT